MDRTARALVWPCAWWLLAATPAWAQTVAPATPEALIAPPPLQQAFEAAWQRQPELRSQALHQQAAQLRRQAADSWTVEPPALELSGKSDRWSGNHGARGYEAGIAVPLWLPGEKMRSAALADAAIEAGEARLQVAQLRTAATVREAYWAWQRSRNEHALAGDRLASVRQLAADVARRVRAGDLARADQHQADAAVAGAQASVAETAGELAAAAQQLAALGVPMTTANAPDASTVAPEPAPPWPLLPDALAASDTRHPALVEWLHRAELARRTSALAQTQSRGNPELTLATTRERGNTPDGYQHTITLGIRIPLGSTVRHGARVSAAQAEALEAESQLELARTRVAAEREAASARRVSAAARLDAAQERARLARETRGFFDKSFRLGETDLPTRLRIEFDAVDAERQAARARLDVAAAVSSLRQALGLLPE